VLVIGRTQDGKHGAEDLFFVDAHFTGDAIKKRATNEIAVLVSLQPEVAPIDNQLGAFLDAKLDVAKHLLHVLPGDQRAHLGFGIGRGADLESPHARSEGLDQPIGGFLADRHGDRHRHAAFASRAVAGAHQGIGCLVHVGIGHQPPCWFLAPPSACTRFPCAVAVR